LPPIKTSGTAFTTLLDLDGHPADDALLRRRRELITDTLRRARPHVVITELFPFGRRVLAPEFLALLEAVNEIGPRPLVVASVRDILVAPAKASRVAETHHRLLGHYDAVLVHGDPTLVPLERSWPLAETVRDLVHYTGYVNEAPPESEGEKDGPGGDILVSGGGSAASLPLFRAAIAASALVRENRWRVLVGRGVAETDFAELRQKASDRLLIERARPDFRSLLARAPLSISQAGYNTVVDLLHSGTRAVLGPFEAGRETEQRLRAGCLAERGLAAVLPEQELSAEALAQAARTALARSAPPAASVDLSGAETSVAVIERLVAAKRSAQSLPPTAPAQVGAIEWRALDDALHRAADCGHSIGFWWRDDDAVAHTTALDRLLELARRFDSSLALAVIPARTAASLVARVQDASGTTILVHGFQHANRAPPDAKKAEFGSERGIGDLFADAASALATARERFASVLLPIFVPPWNRIASELVGVLPDAGYRGLSTFAPRRAREAAPGLVHVNTHLDPIDWRGSRSLIDPNGLTARLAALIEAQLDGGADPQEPLGLLTHHLVHDEAVWTYCEALLERLAAHPNVRYPSVGEVFS
jgi:predicted glycosyltransferase